MAPNVTKEKRRLMRADATRTCNSISLDLPNMSIVTQNQKLAHLKTLLIDLRDLDEKIFITLCVDTVDDDERDQEYDQCSQYTDKIQEAIATIEANLAASQTHPSPSHIINAQTAGGSAPSPPKLNLPQIPLPTFSNKVNEDLNIFF